MNDIILQAQPIISTVVIAVLGILASMVVRLLKRGEQKFNEWMDSKLSKEQRDLMHKLGAEAFSFAETTFKELGGEGKLLKARDYLLTEAGRYGISLSEEQLKAIIEKAVLEYNAVTKPTNTN